MNRHLTRLRASARSHGPQVFRYLVGGFTAAGCEIGSFHLLTVLGVNYVLAGPISNVIGTSTAFVMQKYFVFKKKDNLGKHGFRFAILILWNFIAQNAILIAGVELLHLNPTVSKIISIGASVSWNYLLYKFFVYV